MKNLYTILGYVACPLLLWLNYYYDESAWLYLYSLICIAAIFSLSLGMLGIILCVKELDPEGRKEIINASKKIRGWHRFIGHLYAVVAFLYLTFTHHYVIATISLLTSIVSFAFVWVLRNEISKFKVAS